MNQSGKGRYEGQARAEDDIKRSIGSLKSLKDYTGDMIVADVEKLARSIRGDREIKNAQLRNIYGEVKRMEMDFKRKGFSRDRFVLLKPKLAYAASKKWEVKPIKEVLTVCIDRVQDGKDFRKFVNFFEAVLAYHR
jgi:CRISPR-associated protein Csm2